MPSSVVGRHTRGWFTTSVTVASGASAPTGEIDVRGRTPTHVQLSKTYSTGFLGFKGRLEGYSTSNVVFGGASEASDTQALVPLKIALAALTKLVSLEIGPGLVGLSYIKPYFCSKTSGNTAALNITGGAITIHLGGME